MTRAPDAWALAVDIGGTKLAAARVTTTGTVTGRREVPTAPAPASGEELWRQVCDLLDEVVGDDRPALVGVGCGGPMSWPAGEVSPLNIPAWRGFPLRRRLRDRYDGALVRVHNDAVALAAGEHWLGAGREARSFLGMVVSTGVGGGLVVDGRLVSGRTGNAGHIGHVVVDAQGPQCACGGRGCLEAIARGPAVVAWAEREGWRSPSDAPADGRSLVAAAADGDVVALAALTRAGQALGVAVASVVHLLDLDLVAVGGGMANAGELLFGPARAAYERHAGLDYARGCRIVPAALGADAGLVGAAALVLRGEVYWPGTAD
jgi:glucokinase